MASEDTDKTARADNERSESDQAAAVVGDDATGETGDDSAQDIPESEPQPGPALEPEPPTPTGPEPRPEAVAPVAPPRRVKTGRGLAALALLVALAAGAGSAWTWWQGRGTGGDIEQLRANMPDGDAIASQAMREAREAADTLTREVDSKLARVDLSVVEDVKDEQANIENRVRGQERSLSTLTNRISGFEQDLASLQGVSASVRNTWVRAEAEYFLQTANSRLQLAHDVESALQALRAADERIGALGDPGLTPVRAKLTEEILAIEAVPRPDIEGMALVLNGLATRVGELPVRVKAPSNFELRAGGDESADQSGWQRARSSVAEVFTGIVRVSPTDGDSVELMAPEEIYFLNRNLELQLQVARLALMQGDQANFDGSLDTARDWLREHFDTDDQAVSTMLARLEEMQAVDISPELPDISGSLRLLREIVAASGTS